VPAVRRYVARVLPLDPASAVHATALSIVSGATVIALGQLITLGGVPPFLEMVQDNPDLAGSTSDLDQLLFIAYGFVWTFPCALVAVGFPVVRTLGAAFRRLGLVRPTSGQVLAAILIAVLMVAGAWLLDAGIGWLWNTMGWPRTDSEAFEQLLGAAISPIGAVLIGITAGLGEEMVVRGALQPRLGLLLSNVFFTSLHAFQYGFDALLSVFIIRHRAGTNEHDDLEHRPRSLRFHPGDDLCAGALRLVPEVSQVNRRHLTTTRCRPADHVRHNRRRWPSRLDTRRGQAACPTSPRPAAMDRRSRRSARESAAR
jgi:membrane protease YdiL (CAAX protease family)